MEKDAACPNDFPTNGVELRCFLEREATLGGSVALAAKGPGRGELQLITDFLQSELEQPGVKVNTGVEVTADMILGQHPHTVIIATGALAGRGTGLTK